DRPGAVQRRGPGVDDRGSAGVAQRVCCLVAAGAGLVGDHHGVVQQRGDRGVVGGLDGGDVAAGERLLGGGGGLGGRPVGGGGRRGGGGARGGRVAARCSPPAASAQARWRTGARASRPRLSGGTPRAGGRAGAAARR